MSFEIIRRKYRSWRQRRARREKSVVGGNLARLGEAIIYYIAYRPCNRSLSSLKNLKTIETPASYRAIAAPAHDARACPRILGPSNHQYRRGWSAASKSHRENH